MLTGKRPPLTQIDHSPGLRCSFDSVLPEFFVEQTAMNPENISRLGLIPLRGGRSSLDQARSSSSKFSFQPFCSGIRSVQCLAAFSLSIVKQKNVVAVHHSASR